MVALKPERRWRLRDVDNRDDAGRPYEAVLPHSQVIAYLRGPLWNDSAERSRDDLAVLIDTIDRQSEELDYWLRGEVHQAIEALRRRFGVRLEIQRER